MFSVGSHCVYDSIISEPNAIQKPSSNLVGPPPTSIIDSYGIDIRNIALQSLGSTEQLQRVCRLYFASTHPKFPIISEPRLMRDLPNIFSSARLECVIRCLCIMLVQQIPSEDSLTPQETSLYNLAKISVGLLDAMANFSIEAIQCKLLVILFEMGHGIYPAASISIAACARSVRNLDFHQVDSFSDDGTERETVSWMVHNLDRYGIHPSSIPKAWNVR